MFNISYIARTSAVSHRYIIEEIILTQVQTEHEDTIGTPVQVESLTYERCWKSHPSEFPRYHVVLRSTEQAFVN